MKNREAILPRRLLLLLLLPLLLAGGAGNSSAAEKEAAGMVIAIRGEAEAVAMAGASRKLAIKEPVFQGDTLKTGKGGRLQIMFKDNTIISLGSGSELKVSEYGWSAAKQDGKLTTEVKEGAFRVMGGMISKKSPEKLQTKTPAATIGIRGSMYSGSVKGGQLSVVFEGGRGISLQNSTGMVVINRPGYGASVPGWNAPIKPPQKFMTRDFMKVHHEVDSKTMLKKVLKGMKDPSRAEFNAVINEAVDHDLTPAEARDAVEELKKDPGFGCK